MTSAAAQLHPGKDCEARAEVSVVDEVELLRRADRRPVGDQRRRAGVVGGDDVLVVVASAMSEVVLFAASTYLPGLPFCPAGSPAVPGSSAPA
jgi:hypothetical protein